MKVEMARIEGKPKDFWNIYTWRLVNLVFLSTVAICCGFAAYYIARKAEVARADRQFEAFVTLILEQAWQSAERSALSAASIAAVISAAHENTSEYPQVALNHFKEIAESAYLSTGMRSYPTTEELSYYPIVQPEHIPDFERFAYDYYAASGLPSDTGHSGFGQGIWYMEGAERFRDVTGHSSYGSPNQILVPHLQGSNDTLRFAMQNIHYYESPGKAIDSIIECSQERARNFIRGRNRDKDRHENRDEYMGVDTDVVANANARTPCLAITGFLMPDVGYGAAETASGGATEGQPTMLALAPVYPFGSAQGSASQLTGFVSSRIEWVDILNGLYDGVHELTGVDCVITSEGQTYTLTQEEEGDFWIRLEPTEYIDVWFARLYFTALPILPTISYPQNSLVTLLYCCVV
jgi:hypothetical protein